MNGQGAAPIPDSPASFRAVLLPVCLVALAFFVNYTDRAILGPLLVYLEVDLGLDHVQSTSLLFFLSTGFCSGMLLSGFITSRVRPRYLVGGSPIACGCALFLLSGITSIQEGRFLFTLLGACGGFYFTSAMATLGSIVRTEDWSRAVAVHELAPAVSFIVSPLIAEATATLWGWQGSMRCMGFFSVLAGLIFLVFGKGGRAKTDPPSVAGVVSGLKNPVFWLFTWMTALAVGGEFAPYSVLPLSLTAEQGLGSEEASQLLSFSRMACPLAVLFGGWASMRLGAKRTIVLFLLIHGFSLAAMALPLSLVGKAGGFIAMAGQGTAASLVFPALFTLFARTFPYGQLAMLLAIAVPAATYMGAGLTPILLGASGEYLSFATGYLGFGLVCLATLPVVLFFFHHEERGV